MGIERVRNAAGLAVRTLTRSPGFTAVTVLILAAGVGANTAIFSLANWALLRPVPGVEAPDRLVTIEVGRPGSDGVRLLSHPTVERLSDQAPGLTSFAAYSPVQADVLLGPDAMPRRVDAQIVTPGFFELLGVRPFPGRAFRTEEGDAESVHRVAVVSHDFWREAMDGDREPLGKTLEVNGSSVAVVGVAPEGFRGPGRTDDVALWLPASAATVAYPRFPANILSMQGAPVWLRMAGRLAPGATPEAVATQLRRAAPEISEAGDELRVHEGVGLSRALRQRLTAMLVTLGALVSLLLVLTVANLVNLVLSRVTRRREEASVRKAMGASTLHLTTDLVAEGLVLAALGSVAAVFTGWGLLRLLEGTRVLAWFPQVEGVPLDHRVMAFALVVAVAAVGSATLAGALKIQRSEAVQALRHRGGGDNSRRLLRRGMVALQVALSLALVVGAGLMVRSLDRLFEARLGFDTAGVVTFSLNPGVQGRSDVEADELFRELTLRIRELPGVREAGFTWLAPLGPRRYTEDVRALGEEAEDEAVSADANMVSPGYLPALGIDLVAGRLFDDREYGRADRPERGAVVLNRTLADRLFPGREAVGKEIRMDGRRETSFEVVGVVEDARLVSVRGDLGPALFDPFGNGYRTTSATFAVRTEGDPETLLGRIEALVRERGEGLPLLEAQTLTQRVEAEVAEERALARLIGMFALLSLILAAAGLFGLVSESVQARTREFGIRTALGARAFQVVGLVVRESLATAGVGALAGLGVARLTAALLESRLFGMPAVDVVTFAGATVLLMSVALLAALGPAFRSTRVDPVRVLRTE